MMLMMTVIKSFFDKGSSGDGGIPKSCPITSIPSLPPPPVPSHQPQDDIRGSPLSAQRVLPKVGGVGGSRLQEDLRSQLFPTFFYVWERGGAALFVAYG